MTRKQARTSDTTTIESWFNIDKAWHQRIIRGLYTWQTAVISGPLSSPEFYENSDSWCRDYRFFCCWRFG